MNTLVYVNIEQTGHSLGEKSKVAQNVKRKKMSVTYIKTESILFV